MQMANEMWVSNPAGNGMLIAKKGFPSWSVVRIPVAGTIDILSPVMTLSRCVRPTKRSLFGPHPVPIASVHLVHVDAGERACEELAYRCDVHGHVDERPAAHAAAAVHIHVRIVVDLQ